METNIQTFRGFFQSKSYIHKVTVQEKILVKPIIMKLSLLVLLSIVLSISLGTLGYGSEGISRQITQQSNEYIASLQFFHATGLVLKGMFYPILYLLLAVTLSSFLFKDIRVGVLVHIHLYFIAFIVLNQAVQLVLFYFWGLPAISSPFSLGILSQIYVEQSFFNHFLSYINLFYIAGLVYLVALIDSISTRKRGNITIMLIGIHLFIALVGSGISVIDIDALLKS
jgi:hypothetical protein